MGYDAQLIAPQYDADGKLTGYTPSFANKYAYQRAQWGGIQQYDFNISFNWKDQIYAGLTFGAYNVNLHSRTNYAEELVDSKNNTGEYYMSRAESLSGAGFDVKLGIIVRPLEDSPFRFGVSIATPIFFDLTQSSYLYMNSPYAFTDDKGNKFEHTEADVEIGDFDYRIRTPWKVNLSMATTVGNYLALDAEYEISDYKGTQCVTPTSTTITTTAFHQAKTMRWPRKSMLA